MSKIKQIILCRKDLKMNRGKIAAQCSHASLKVLLDAGMFIDTADGRELRIPVCDEWKSWLEDEFTKIVLAVNSEAELLDLYNKAKGLGIPASLIQDMGHTVFHGVPTYTTVALGPWNPEALDSLTGHLSLYS
jgi:PTH2 family peptidyl-tRNA hydrolase